MFQVNKYRGMSKVTKDEDDSDEDVILGQKLCSSEQTGVSCSQRLRALGVRASSTPVECVFNHGGIILKLRCAYMIDKQLT